mmetsp:Transcript_43185/g.101212  ORF Transcript_43185/g.101212 Transcript_43185/m.101212 type:complete len:221 (+) Transcript_43185:551-1213(+)
MASSRSICVTTSDPPSPTRCSWPSTALRSWRIGMRHHREQPLGVARRPPPSPSIWIQIPTKTWSRRKLSRRRRRAQRQSGRRRSAHATPLPLRGCRQGCERRWSRLSRTKRRTYCTSTGSASAAGCRRKPRCSTCAPSGTTQQRRPEESCTRLLPRRTRARATSPCGWFSTAPARRISRRYAATGSTRSAEVAMDRRSVRASTSRRRRTSRCRTAWAGSG